jgi:hypothetical protein
MTVTIENTYTGNNSTTDYSFTFPYLDDSDIKASLDGVATTNFRLLNATTVQFVNNTTANTPTPPGTDVAIRIYRSTAYDSPKATFYPGSAIRSNDLNDNSLQNLYVTQESNDKVDKAWLTGDPTVISTETWYTTDDTKIATTKAIEARIDTKIDTALTTDVVGGQSITVTDDSPSSGKITVSVTAGSIRGTELDGDAVDGSKIADDSINSEHYVDASIDHQHLSNDCIDGDNIQDDVINSEHYAAGSIDTEHIADGQITSAKLHADAVVTNSEQAGVTTNDTSFFTTSAGDSRYYRLGSVEEIQSGETWTAADNKIATTSAIDARIIDLVDDVGGFVPIANETSFPNANPDVNNGAGTLISIKALSGNLTSNGSGVATISNGNVASNATITINGLENSTTYAATLGMIVETTSTLHTYTFHRVTPKATEVTTVAGSISNVNTVAGSIANVNTVAGNNTNISTVAGANSNITTVAGSISNVNTVATNIASVNNFADQYRIASSDPTSSLNTGDLVFNTTANELRVYNGSSWQGGVTATGNLISKADIGASSGVPGTGTAGEFLQTNGSGTLSWEPIATVLTETNQTISSSYTITTNKNAMSVGDVTLASGVVLTIPANSKYILIS